MAFRPFLISCIDLKLYVLRNPLISFSFQPLSPPTYFTISMWFSRGFSCILCNLCTIYSLPFYGFIQCHIYLHILSRQLHHSKWFLDYKYNLSMGYCLLVMKIYLDCDRFPSAISTSFSCKSISQVLKILLTKSKTCLKSEVALCIALISSFNLS